MQVPCGMSGESGHYIHIIAALIDFWSLGARKKTQAAKHGALAY